MLIATIYKKQSASFQPVSTTLNLCDSGPGDDVRGIIFDASPGQGCSCFANGG